MVDERTTGLPQTDREPVLQTNYERERGEAHSIFIPTAGELVEYPEMARLERAGVTEIEPSYLSMFPDPRSRIRLTYYEKTWSGIKITEPGADMGKVGAYDEHNLGSLSDEGESMGTTRAEVEARYEEEFRKKRGYNFPNRVFGPVYRIVERDGVRFPERVPGQYTFYDEHVVTVSDDTATAFRPYQGRKLV